MTEQYEGEPSDMAVQRAIGRLEGRMTALEVMLKDSVIRTDRQMNAVTGEVMNLRTEINGLKGMFQTASGSFRTGWHTITVISMSLFAIASLALSVLNLIWHHQ